LSIGGRAGGRSCLWRRWRDFGWSYHPKPWRVQAHEQS
jgi:hypothetical protein